MTQPSTIQITGPLTISGATTWSKLGLGIPTQLAVAGTWDPRWFSELPYSTQTHGRIDTQGGAGEEASKITFTWSVNPATRIWTITPVAPPAGTTNNLWRVRQLFTAIRGSQISNGGADVYIEVLEIV
jgi:hypothetical protein